MKQDQNIDGGLGNKWNHIGHMWNLPPAGDDKLKKYFNISENVFIYFLVES